MFLFFLGIAVTAGFTLAGGVKNPNGLFVALAASGSLGFAMLVAMIGPCNDMKPIEFASSDE